jgi:hypothetical protein
VLFDRIADVARRLGRGLIMMTLLRDCGELAGDLRRT